MIVGMPYPITKDPLGLLRSQKGLAQLKSDLLVLLLTNPGERVMLSEFGTPLRSLLFEVNDETLQQQAFNIISRAIERWEPRIAVKDIIVTNGIDEDSLHRDDAKEDLDHILFIRIEFFDPGDIQDIQVLSLEIPLNI